MLNILLTVISIALLILIAAVAVYYGGSTYAESSADAIAGTYGNQAQQVQGAATLYKTKEGGTPQDIVEDLQGAYLSSVPQSPAGVQWAIDGSFAFVEVPVANTNNDAITAEVCQKITDNGFGLVNCIGSDGTSDVAGNIAANETTPIEVVDGGTAVIYYAY